MSKLIIALDTAVEEHVKRTVDGIIAKHLENAVNELYGSFDTLSTKFTKEVSAAAKKELERLVKESGRK